MMSLILPDIGCIRILTCSFGLHPWPSLLAILLFASVYAFVYASLGGIDYLLQPNKVAQKVKRPLINVAKKKKLEDSTFILAVSQPCISFRVQCSKHCQMFSTLAIQLFLGIENNDSLSGVDSEELNLSLFAQRWIPLKWMENPRLPRAALRGQEVWGNTSNLRS